MVAEVVRSLGGFVSLGQGLLRQVEVVFGACPMNWRPGLMLLLLAAPPVAARSSTF